MHASLIDYLNRGKPKLIVYDVLFADEDLRVGFPYGGDTWSGRESDKALADTITNAGNVLLLADATFVGETTEKQLLPDQGYRLTVPGVLERRVVFPPAGPLSSAAAALGPQFFEPRRGWPPASCRALCQNRRQRHAVARFVGGLARIG